MSRHVIRSLASLALASLVLDRELGSPLTHPIVAAATGRSCTSETRTTRYGATTPRPQRVPRQLAQPDSRERSVRVHRPPTTGPVLETCPGHGGWCSMGGGCSSSTRTWVSRSAQRSSSSASRPGCSSRRLSPPCRGPDPEVPFGSRGTAVLWRDKTLFVPDQVNGEPDCNSTPNVIPAVGCSPTRRRESSSRSYRPPIRARSLPSTSIQSPWCWGRMGCSM